MPGSIITPTKGGPAASQMERRVLLTPDLTAAYIAKTWGQCATMELPKFLVGMFATSFIVAIWADKATGSVWTALGWAMLAMVILQVGYIGLVVGLIYRRASKGADASPASAAVNDLNPTGSV
ncbi:hypothetical protein RFN28_22345 [Mesorhizobium sp. VK24D]|uniref:Uncharacterized protein n=1 Tax=Mesorhizobium album TaxID=3072314 RepID=A0ABU4Y2K3_9HYPH|nr:hypothetical protein [Mesorhizobium sp. VK24D]MDX8481180.1 hypothetical protein [Mesorhizobium sp. VK24D]